MSQKVFFRPRGGSGGGYDGVCVRNKSKYDKGMSAVIIKRVFFFFISILMENHRHHGFLFLPLFDMFND